jgi:NADH:ubiquinone oxidoreductase subunit K
MDVYEQFFIVSLGCVAIAVGLPLIGVLVYRNRREDDE